MSNRTSHRRQARQRRNLELRAHVTRRDYVVGQSYHNSYWRCDYTVLAYDASTGYVTVRWEDGRTNTHLTALDDRDFEIPAIGACPRPDEQHGDMLRNRRNAWGAK